MGDAFEKGVTLKDANTKILYKFVVDGNWTTDHEAPQEDDGSNNVNNVLHPENIKKAPTHISSAAPGSTTAGLAGGVAKEQAAPGAFPETPQNESEKTFGVAPIPASSGVGNPVSVPAGEAVPESVTAKGVDSTVTTSQDDYEKAGSAPFPGASGTSGEAQDFSVKPIAASEGIGNPVQTKPGEAIPEQVTTNTVDSTVTTSKEDYEKAGSYSFPAAGAAVGGALAGAAAAFGFGSKEENKKNLIPESSLPMGEGAGAGQDAGPHIQSAGPQSTTAALAAGVPLEKDKVAAGVPEEVKQSLTEAHQSAEAAASPEAVKEKSALEKELLSKVSPEESTGESAKDAVAGQSSYYGLATSVPKTVEESMKQAHASPEAAAETSAVAEKSALEKELESKVSRSEATGEPAPVVTAETSSTAPVATGAAVGGAAAAGAAGVAGVAAGDKTAPGGSSHAAAAVADGAEGGEDIKAPKPTTNVEKTEGDATEYAPPVAAGKQPGVSPGAAAMLSDGTDSGLADEPAVKMMNQNDGTKDTAPTTKAADTATPAAATTAATTSTTEKAKDTPTKPTAATPSSNAPTSATSTPTKKPAAESPSNSPAGTDKKKKHRISSFFKKVFN